MSNEPNDPNANETSPASEAAPQETPRPSVAPEAAAPDAVAQLTEERNNFRDQLLRARADFDNFRKRSRRDEQDAVKRAEERLLEKLLPVFDNLERAAGFAKTSTDAKAIGDGVVMVIRLFEDTLKQMGGTRLKSVGTVFDPNVHEAIQQVEDDEHPAGVIVQEFVPGYQYGDVLLRAAQVVVSKGKPNVVEAKVVDEATDSDPPSSDDELKN